MIQIWKHQDLGVQGVRPAAAVFWALSSLCAESLAPEFGDQALLWHGGMLRSRFVQRFWAMIMIHYSDISWNIGDLLGWCRSNYLLTLSCGAVSQREVALELSRVDSWETLLSWCAKHLGKTCFFIQLDFWANNRHTTSHSPRIAESQHWSAGMTAPSGYLMSPSHLLYSAA